MVSLELPSAPIKQADSQAPPSYTGSRRSAGVEGALLPEITSDDGAGEEPKPSFEQMWPVIAIISERTEDYLIEWDGVDKDGKPYKPSWEKKDMVTPDLVEEWRKGGRPKWKRDKKERKRLSKLAKKARAKSAVKSAPKVSVVAVETGYNMQDPSGAPAPFVHPKVPTHSDGRDLYLVPSPAPVASTSTSASNLRKRKSSANLVEQPDRQRIKMQAVPAIQVELPTSERGGSVASSRDPVSPFRPSALARTSPAPSSDVEIEVVSRALSAARANSPSSVSSRPLGPVQVPRPSAFARLESVSASSQADPIEDPDSSPPRRPLGLSLSRQLNAPAPVASNAPTPRFITVVKPVRPRLELYEEPGSSPPALDAGDGSDVEEENLPSSSDGSYFSQPVAVGMGKARPIQIARGPFSAVSGGGASRSLGSGGLRGGPSAISIPLAKIPFFRPPPMSFEADNPFRREDGSGEVAIAVARPMDAPAVTSSQPHSTPSDFYDQTLPRLDPAQLEQLMTQYERLPEARRSTQDGPSDAGEGGGRANGEAPSSSSSHQRPQQQQQQQPHRSSETQAPRTTSTNGNSAGSTGGGASAPGSGWYGSYSGSYSGSFPPYNTPYGLSHTNFARQGQSGTTTPKRELDGDSADDSSKKARTNDRPEAERRPPPPVTAPASTFYHSPSFPAYPSYQPPPPGYPFPPPLPSAHYSHHLQGHFPPMPAYSPPAPQPTTHQTISPSLARVLGPMTSGPIHSPLPSPQASGPSTPTVIAPSPTTSVPPPALPSPAGGLSPRRQRSQSPVAALKSPSLARAPTFAGSAAVSRNASPAPGGGSNLDGLINLVIASPHIVEGDNTKSEIVKFLRDPKAYIARPEQPLSRSAHWAFELRRMTHEGIDKTDFIILHSETGTHQLKRVARSQAQFDFARSLSHAVSKPGAALGALTPSAENGPVLAPVASSMTRDQLEAELETLRKSAKAQAEELATLRPLVADIAKMKTDVEKLTKQNKSLANSKEAAQNDFAYMQAQYTTASNAAVARACEAQVAEEETTKLRGMLDIGLKQRDLVAKSESKRLKLEIARLKTEVALCKSMERRVQASGLLEKAGKWDEMVAREKYDNQMYDDREQAMLEEEEEAEREREREEAEEREQERLEALERAQERAAREKREAAVAAAAPPSVEPTLEERFACEWRVDKESQVEPCGVIVDSRDALQAHLFGHVPTAEPALAQIP